MVRDLLHQIWAFSKEVDKMSCPAFYVKTLDDKPPSVWMAGRTDKLSPLQGGVALPSGRALAPNGGNSWGIHNASPLAPSW